MPHWTEAHAATNGIDTHYLRTGGGRPPVVLLHGLTDNGACWGRLARDLEADYDLIMPDARGHGRSSAPPAGYRAEDRAADALALIDALDLDRPALIGHSMGGLTAAMVAAAAPGRVRGVVLEDPAFIPPAAWAENARGDWSAGHRATQALSEEQLIARGRAESPRWSPDTFAPWARAKLETSVRAFDWFAEPATDFAAVVAQIAAPALLVTGDPELGAIITAQGAAALQALNPRLGVAHFPGAGHCVRYEQPERYAAAVRAFLGELYGRR
jgi:pimeloyl-ACP methyl ester carboxylesterase